MTSSSLLDRAEALRDGVEDLLLDEGTAPATQDIKAAMVGISHFCEHGASELGLAALGELAVTLERAKSMLADASPESVMLIEEAMSWARELRAMALDELARLPPDVAAANLSQSSSTLGLGASFRAPALHQAGDIPALPLLKKARSWDDTTEEAREPEDEEQLSRDPLFGGLVRLCRDAMEDIGILGNLRRLEDEEKLGDAIPFEERLLANLDFLWSLDTPFHADVPKVGVPRALFRYATEWTTPDWGRAFALSFGLGCSSSETALRWVLLAMRRTATASLGAYVHGLSLASSPHIDKTVLTELRTGASPQQLVALLEVAERRGAYTASAIVPLLAHPVLEVRIAALRAMRSAPPDVATSAALQFLHASEEGATEAADELARRNHPEGITYLKRQLGATDLSTRTVALRALVLSGSIKDEALVLEHTASREDGALWLGFYGWSSVLPTLLERLAKARDGVAGEMAGIRVERAIRRITGIATASIELPALRAKIEERGFLKKPQRLRLGEAHALRAVVDELSNLTTLQGDRRILERELASLQPEAASFSIEAFVGAQLAWLATVETKPEKDSEAPRPALLKS